ncbi:anti-sigma factor [Variovorax sp. OV329]|uniref:anti-sigma factor family protein n=1 Tax=Variovorax sp. OV329 TaxID=1882825 RepID=UPI0008E29446|nr:anti-sigma factor [Variovorax sp. OV329]SFM66476.1 Transmembrane transcriptional regulator (anti-sigma factor RsiW) [Variovorax sp. OV329]
MSAPTDSDDDARRWAAQREALRGLHRELLHEPVPEHLLQTVEQAGNQRFWSRRWMQAGALAASVLVAFGAGWIGHGQWNMRSAVGTQATRAAAPALAFAHDAAVAHAVYSPEKRHPVEVAATEQQHLVQWLSRRLDKPLKVPDLNAEGYALVGGRLLPGAEGARAQFMFEDGAGQRVTLYIGALTDRKGASAQESAFHFAAGEPVASFYWVDQGFGYALAGKLPREKLLALADVVYKQL